MRFIPILVILSLFLITPNYDAKCVFTQTCLDPFGIVCNPPGPVPDHESEGFPYNYSFMGEPACPDFVGQNVCCNNYQNSVQMTNFALSDENFGSQNGGCDVCAANLKRFWCHFSCQTNQSDYVDLGDLENRTDPSTGEVVFARTINVNVSTDLACSLYQSCEKVPFVTELSQTSTAAGFLTFMGQNGVVQAKAWITFNVQPNVTGSLNFDVNACSDKFNGTDQYGYNITHNCTCNTCSTACIPEGGIEIGNITDGFDGWFVLYMYIGIFILASITIIYRFYRKKAKYSNPRIGQSINANQSIISNQNMIYTNESQKYE